jgi:D-lactate dehydrogenase
MITGKYKKLYDELVRVIPSSRVSHDPLSLIAHGTDASFYRLIPKIVVKVMNENELVHVVQSCAKLNLPLTYKAAGTSLSGQAISDSVLVIVTHGWQKYQILDDGERIKLQPGLRGQRANQLLAKYGKKIGPDPASLESAMIGGIAANNASGMCCGTSENSYRTISDIRIITADGDLLDTSSEESRKSFISTHSDIIEGIKRISDSIRSDDVLFNKIAQKFKIKNTTGYSLNSFTDYIDPIDIIKHLIIGSEGTLAFISDITYKTVVEHPFKAVSYTVFYDIESACKAVSILKNMPVSAVELMDRAAIRSVESSKGVPDYLKTIPAGAAALLIETRASANEEIEQNIDSIKSAICDIQTVLPVNFTKDTKEQAILWKIRKETLPTVAAMRQSGTTSIIEDICFPVKRLSEATLDLQELFVKHGYSEAIIFGHALEGNLHFMFSPDFSKESEVKRYSDFMDDVAAMVVDKYDGSLKAEHGTGRNMAPYVEMEWGEKAYSLMKEIKELFDPQGILNPGVILNDDKKIHLKNLKPLISIRDTADKCMECGFCEGVCVSEGFTLSPRQRVAVFREIERLRKSGEEPHLAAELNKLYKYYGMATCATDSLCYTKCPVKIDTGKLVKELRHEAHSPFQERVAVTLAKNMNYVTAVMRTGLGMVYRLRLLFGKKIFGSFARGVRKVSFGLIPLWNEHFPDKASRIKQPLLNKTSDLSSTSEEKQKVVYFPSCITRSMGVSKEYSRELELTKLTEKLLSRAGFEIVYPENMDSLCCGMAFSSKGFTEAGQIASGKLEAALYKASDGCKYPVLCDMSPCLYTMKTNMGERLNLYEPAEFIDKFLIDKLNIKQLDKKIAIFSVCSAKKMEVDVILEKIARRCAKEVVVIDSNCCGFAGDRGFILPELNRHGLRNLREQSVGCQVGYATSRTCEIGLSEHGGITYKSILYLVEEASK